MTGFVVSYFFEFIILGFALTNSWGPSQVTFTYIGFSFCILVYIVNIFTLLYFYRMAVNYMEQVDIVLNVSKIKAKCCFLAMILIIGLACFRFSVYLEVWFMVNWPRGRFNYRYWPSYRYPNIIFIYFNLVCPYIVAGFLCYVIHYLGSNAAAEVEAASEGSGE